MKVKIIASRDIGELEKGLNNILDINEVLYGKHIYDIKYITYPGDNTLWFVAFIHYEDKFE